MDANEPKNIRLRTIHSFCRSQGIRCSDGSRHKAFSYTDTKDPGPKTLPTLNAHPIARREVGASLSALSWIHLRSLAFICGWIFPRSAYSIFFGGRSPPMDPRRCDQPSHGAFRFHGAAWIATSLERGGVIGTVRKLHKVSDKPASTLGFWAPDVVSKKPHPF